MYLKFHKSQAKAAKSQKPKAIAAALPSILLPSLVFHCLSWLINDNHTVRSTQQLDYSTAQLDLAAYSEVLLLLMIILLLLLLARVFDVSLLLLLRSTSYQQLVVIDSSNYSQPTRYHLTKPRTSTCTCICNLVLLLSITFN